jgi:nicotinate-nucleotide pyrophosphorylase (carboxylating)
MISHSYIQNLVALAIREDVGQRDITASLLPKDKQTTAIILTREQAIVCGCDFVDEVFRQLSSGITLSWEVQDGQQVRPNQVLCHIKGPVTPLLTGERVALNFLQTLSGTATITHKYAEMLKNTHTKLLDTRKTLPGFRLAQKYAVTCGGGQNHRFGLFDAYLIKENHIAAVGSIKSVIKLARQQQPGKVIEIEVENLRELEEAIAENADIIMLDNFDLPSMRKAVKINAGRAKLEVSGNITINQLEEIAQTGVDYISVGNLTKNIQAIDLSMRVITS